MAQTNRSRITSQAWLAVAATALLFACDPEKGPSQAAQGTTAADPDAPHELTASLGYLISSAAEDFRTHSPGRVEVRTVRFGLRDTTGGRESYVLCGEFRRPSDGDSAPWTPFATVETSKYELWLGETTFCQTLSGAWNTSDSLTRRLQSALD